MSTLPDVIVRAATPPHCEPIPTLDLGLRIWTRAYLARSCQHVRRSFVVKTLIATAATLALVTAAAAADLPRPQPAPRYAEAPVVGKMPIGKSPIGKSPIGKNPVVARY
jgi:hypothetical protein